MDRLQIARRLAGLGFSLIPVHGKVPSVKWEAFQVAPSSDDNHVSWFGNGTPRNIGIVTGAVSGVVVVDTDSDEAEAWAAANLPDTPMKCITGGGGRHRYYRHPGATITIPNRARIDTGQGTLALDVRGDGGFVVAPGSVHDNGNIYKADPAPWPQSIDELPVFAPAWLGQAFAPRRAVSASGDASPAVAEDGKIPNGRRNAELTSLAGSMRRRGMTQAAMVAALRVENDTRCDPPLPDDEVVTIAESVGRYQPEPPPAERERRRLVLLNDAELMNRPDPEYLVEGHIVTHTLAGAFGLPESYKSFIFTVDLGLSVATGTPWLGSRIVSPGPVVAVVAEGADAIKLRVQAWKVSRSLPLTQSYGFYVVPQSVQLSEPAEVQALIDAIAPLAPKLVILDTLPRCLGGLEENSSTEIGRAIDAMDRIRLATGAVVMPITHSTKDGGDIRGSSALRGAADTLFKVTKEDDLCVIHCDKQKDAAPFADIKIKMVPVPETQSVVPRLFHLTYPSSQLTKDQYTVWSTLMELCKSDGATYTELQKLCTGVHPRTFARAVNRLEELGGAYQSGKRYFGKPLAPDMMPEGAES